jgi:hypothetical protein
VSGIEDEAIDNVYLYDDAPQPPPSGGVILVLDYTVELKISPSVSLRTTMIGVIYFPSPPEL